MTRIASSRVPGWSWASIQSPVSYSSFDEVEIIATVVDMRSTYLDPLKIFGAVESGELDTQSCLVPVEHSLDLAGHGVDMVSAAEGVKQGGQDTGW